MKKIFVTVFAVLFMTFCAYNLIIPPRDFLENENRYSAKMPEFSFSSLASGEFSENLEKYITDKTAFRDFFVSLKSNVERLSGKKDNNGVYFCDDDYLIQVYNSTNYDNTLKANIDAINALAKEDGINVSFSLIPTAYEILKEKLPSFSYDDYQIDVLNKTKKALCNVNFINSYSSLSAAKNEYIYYRTDHHQTMHGSYIVYSDIAEGLGKSPYSKKDFEIKSMADDFYGTTWSKATVDIKGDSIIKYEPHFDASYLVSYDGKEETNSLYSEKNIAIKDKYTYYLDGNHGITTIKTKIKNEEKLNEKNGEKLAVIKDSYAHSIIPLLANHYSEIVVFDLRYYNLSIPEYLKSNNINNVLFVYNIDNFISDNNLAKITAYLKSR